MSLSGYEAKVSSASFSKDVKFIITTSMDRTLKRWERKKPKEEVPEHVNKDESKPDVMMEKV